MRFRRKSTSTDALPLWSNELGLDMVRNSRKSVHTSTKPANAEVVLRDLKRKLQWLVQTSPGGTFNSFAELMEQHGCRITASTVGRWVDLRTGFAPGARELWVIGQIRPNVSVDWLLGRRQASTVDEQFIEQSMKGS